MARTDLGGSQGPPTAATLKFVRRSFHGTRVRDAAALRGHGPNAAARGRRGGRALPITTVASARTAAALSCLRLGDVFGNFASQWEQSGRLIERHARPLRSLLRRQPDAHAKGLIGR